MRLGHDGWRRSAFCGIWLAGVCTLGAAPLHQLRVEGQSGYDQRNFYVVHDVTSRLKPGENVLGVWLGDGFFNQDRVWGPQGMSYGQPLPPCRRLGTERARSLRELKPGTWIYDFGVNLVGWAKFTVDATPGTKLTVRFAENVLTDGSLNFATVGVEPTKVIQTDTYICRGGSTPSPSLWPALVSQGHQQTAWKALQNASNPGLKHLASSPCCPERGRASHHGFRF